MARLLLFVLATIGLASAQDTEARSGLALEDRFKRLDRNGDGKLTRQELRAPRIFGQMDKDGDRRFAEAAPSAPPLPSQRFPSLTSRPG